MVPAPLMDIHENGLYGGIGPHPSFVQVAKPYIFESTVQQCLDKNGGNEARELSNRLQGVQWIDSVRKALSLPVRTFMSAVVYYHRFRLAHVEADFMNVDAAAAALFTACKIEDTLKKSRDVLCAAYNLKASEHLAPDDSVFEEPSKRLIGLERLMLESSGFDFRNRNPQAWVIKFTRLGGLDRDTVGKTAYRVCLDLYRTHAPLKQTSSTLGLASVELAARLFGVSTERLDSFIGDPETMAGKWGTSRAEVMETLLDLLELYTHNRPSTSVGPEHPIDTFIAIRITLNKEATAENLPRYTESAAAVPSQSQSNGNATNGTKPSPMSPANPLTAPSTVQQSPAQPDSMTASPGLANIVKNRQIERRDGTVRYMLDSERAQGEQDTVASYFKEEWEEYEEVIERPAKPTNTQSARSVAEELDIGLGRDSSAERPKDGNSRERDRKRERSPERDRERYRSRDRFRGHDRDDRRRDRDHESHRHRHHESHRDREPERERDRPGHRHRDERDWEDHYNHRHRERDMARDGPRDGHRDRERERDRDREKDRERTRDRERERDRMRDRDSYRRR
ncbi:hypothetical protein K461DRAFT_320327 [Myriangium duriaei CBS 260.36]|uniref:RNA polymerase II holoenzyme cyclin-like subunit n=1 Tax=Myriangium duriaei CBS 260.36 TaxID=1168546 RepID=A0A9P4MID3_9PEZI|nr:hypothetical protein K461DRAFT_320327 [Myriangium duriaei CBS 260.36]